MLPQSDAKGDQSNPRDGLVRAYRRGRHRGGPRQGPDGRPGLAKGAGMLIGGGPIPLMWIHTFFMRFPIDLVFLDRANRIVRIVPDVKPWRLTAPVFGARAVLELEAGAAARNSSHIGDEIKFEELA